MRKFLVVRFSCTVSWLVILLEVLVLLQNLFRTTEKRVSIIVFYYQWLVILDFKFHSQLTQRCSRTVDHKASTARLKFPYTYIMYIYLTRALHIYLTYSKSTPYISSTVINRVPPASKLKKPESRRRAKKMKTACTSSHWRASTLQQSSRSERKMHPLSLNRRKRRAHTTLA